MPFIIVRNDLLNVKADAFVLPSNTRLQLEGGVGAHVAQSAGFWQLQEACNQIGGCPVGQAVTTSAFNVDAQYIIHAVDPIWQGGSFNEESLLKSTYESAFKQALSKKCTSLALPLLGSGSNGFPSDIAFESAVASIREFLNNNDDFEITLVVYDDEAFSVANSRFDNIRTFISSFEIPQTRVSRNRFNEPQAVQREDAFENKEAFEKQESLESVEKRICPICGSKVDLGARFCARCGSTLDSQDFNQASYGNLSAPKSMQGCGSVSYWGNASEINSAPVPPTFSSPAYSPAPCSNKKSAKKPKLAPLVGGLPKKRKAASVTKKSKLDFLTGSQSKQQESRYTADSSMAPCVSASAVMQDFASTSKTNEDLESWLSGLDEGFSATLFKLIDKKGLSDPEVYKKANISRQLFSKIRSSEHYQPKKPTAVALCIALELTIGETEDLLRRAGYALSYSNHFDLIIRYFITHEIYDIFEINNALFVWDCQLLG